MLGLNVAEEKLLRFRGILLRLFLLFSQPMQLLGCRALQLHCCGVLVTIAARWWATILRGG